MQIALPIMKATNKFYPLSMGAIVCALAIWSGWPKVRTPVVTVSRQEQSKPGKDPCWFMTLRDKSIPYEEIEKRQDREMLGYPGEIPLGEAIRIFNEEKQCSGLLAPYPALAEDEVIAAIVSGPDPGKQGAIWLAQKDALWEIASKKVMPKGSLFVAEAGYQAQESPLRPWGTVASEGIRISLLLGLDKDHEHGRLLKPEQALVIRKTYSKVKIVQ